MKKFLLFFLTIALFASCSGGSMNVPDDPGKAAIYYFEAAKSGDIDTFLDSFYFGTELSEFLITIGKMSLKETILGIGEFSDEESDTRKALSGMKATVLDSHTHGSDQAHVTIQLTLPDDKAKEFELEMAKINGVWRFIAPF